MRTVGNAFKEHLLLESTTLCSCWRMTRKDGKVFGFTDNTFDLVIDGVTYSSAAGMKPSTASSTAGLIVDSMEIMSILTAAGATDRDVRAGLFDKADMLFFVVNYADLSMGKMIVKTGNLGTVQLKQGKFVAEFRSLTQETLSDVVELTRQTCRVRRLGECPGCCVNLNGNTVQGLPIRSLGTITLAQSRRDLTVTFDNPHTWPVGFFKKGLVLFLSGQNMNIEGEIKSSNGSSLTLQQPAPFTYVIGDRVRVEAGCDRRIETCGDKFGNNLNFRGEPFVPGTDKVHEIKQK